MQSIIEANYEVVPERTLPVIASEIRFIESQVAKTALEGAIEIGARLKEAKDQVGHGNFENWCAENLNYSKRKAENFMRISAEYGDKNSPFSKTQTSAFFSISKALELLALPEEEVENFIESHDVESLTVKELKDEIKQLKAERDEALLSAESAPEPEKIVVEDTEKVKALEDKMSELDRMIEAEQSDHNKTAAKLRDAELKLQKAERDKAEAEKRAREIDAKMDEEAKNRNSAIAEAVEENKKAVADELKSLGQENEMLTEEVDRLRKQLNKTSSENMMRFKLLADQVQSIIREAVKCAGKETDADKSQKMLAALRQVIEASMN
ncbi:MAG: DUF3102 domain-containing protein [Clostridiales bacterium]|nr:DUF3102 domain-containing protein [Candidatus Crickella merdequi]